MSKALTDFESIGYQHYKTIRDIKLESRDRKREMREAGRQLMTNLNLNATMVNRKLGKHKINKVTEFVELQEQNRLKALLEKLEKEESA